MTDIGSDRRSHGRSLGTYVAPFADLLGEAPQLPDGEYVIVGFIPLAGTGVALLVEQIVPQLE